jgi:hypothetical protein
MQRSIEAKLSALGLVLPPMPVPIGNYLPFTLTGNLLFLSGKGPQLSDNSRWKTGRVGEDVSTDQAYQDFPIGGNSLAVSRKSGGRLFG